MGAGHQTVKVRALSFKLLSRQGACVHELVAKAHKRYPYRMFLLLQHPEEALTMVNDPACLLDPWSLKVKEQYPDLSSPEFREVTLLHAMNVSTNIAYCSD